MKKILLIIAISCMPFLTGVAVAADADSDGIDDLIDNCVNDANADQKDTDGDRMGDECDTSDTTISNPHLRYGFANPAESKRMGFGFAQPIITIIPGYTDASTPPKYKPVVIIAGGYDPTKDYRGTYDKAAIGDPAIGTPSGDPVTYTDFVRGSGPKNDGSRTEDKVGNAIYFLDALSGNVVARIEGRTRYHDESDADAVTAPANGTRDISGSGIITAATGENGAGEIIDDRLKYSIPATVTIVDSQGDGITDRLYFIDIVGNVWRLDLNVTTVSDNIANDWRLEPFAALGAEGKATGTYAANERRFFNQIDVVRTRKPGGNTNVDALLVGSGNLADPKGKTIAVPSGAAETGLNAFFMVYDDNTQPIAKGVSIAKITLANLYAVPTGSETSTKAAADTVETQLESANKGWYFDLVANEKVVSAATTVNGATYFTTIEANPNTTGCVAPDPLPKSYIYAMNMHNAKGLYNGGVINTGPDDGKTYYNRSKELGEGKMAFQQLDPFVATDGDVTMILPGGDEEDLKGSDGEDKKLEGAGSYWRTEK